MKKKTCSIEEATEWLAKTCPRIYAEAKASGPLTREDVRKAVEILKKNNNPKDYEVVIMPGSPAHEYISKMRPPSTHKRTYKKGSKIRNIATFRKWCMNGGPVYYNHKFMHYGFIVSMPFRAICDALSQGVIWKAVRI